MAEKIFIKGKDISFYVNGYVLGCAEDVDIEITTSMITTTTKCSNVNGVLWEENLPNVNSIKFSGNGNVPQSTSQGYDVYSFQQLALAQFQQLKVYVTWGIAGTNLFYGMNAYLSSNKLSSPVEDVAKFSFDATGTGAPTTAAIS